MEARAWYEVAVKYEKGSAGNKVTERYLANAVGCSEAEDAVIEALDAYVVNGTPIDTRSVKLTGISDVLNRDNDKFYLAKLSMTEIDEETFKDKRSVSQILVGGKNFEDAYYAFKEGMMGSVSITEWELFSLTETKILEVMTA